MQRRRLIQPLAVVAASLTFALLFSGMAMMDLRQVEKLLHAMLKQKAISVAENIEGASWNTYHRIWHNGKSPRNFSAMLPECDSMPAIQDSLPKATEDEGSARYRAMQLSIRKAIATWPVGRDIVYLAVEDNRGRLLAQTGNIPEEKVSECLLLAGNARDSGSPVSECVKIGDIKFLEVILPFTLGENVVGKIRIGLETYKSDVMLQEKRRHIFLWAALMMLIGIAVMGILYRIQSRHLSRLQTMQEHLHHAERLSSLANLGAKVAHEVRNPLNAIGMAAQRLQREFVPAENEAQSQEFRHITQIVRDEIRRLNAIIEDFLSLSRSNRLHLHDESLVPVLERVLFLSREAMNVLLRYDYPGNVRELKNIIERAVVIARDTVISTDDLPFQKSPSENCESGILPMPSGTLRQSVAMLEQQMIQNAMLEAGNHQSHAALRLGLSERMLRYKLKKYHLSAL